MALSSSTVWEVRTDGHDDNGGGFVPGGAGVDRTQQASPHVTFDGATVAFSTDAEGVTLTLTGHTVSTDDTNNILNITGGANFTTGRYHITGVNVPGNTWTIDRDSSSAGSPTGGIGRMGGAIASPGVVTGTSGWVAGNTMHVRAGTYTMTSTANVTGGRISTNVSASDGARSRIIGYETTRLDYAAKPVFQAASNNSHTLVTAIGNFFLIDNIELAPGAQTGIIAVATSGLYDWVRRCKVNGTAQGIVSTGSYGRVEECEVTGCSSTGAIQLGTGNGQIALRNYVHGCTTEGIDLAFTQGSSAIGNLVVDCTTGIIVASNARQATIQGNTVYDCTGSGIEMQGPAGYAINNLSVGNTDWGIEGSVGNANVIHFLNNATYNNTSGHHTLGQAENHVELTADPFTNAAGNDFSLNDTAGGGAAAKGAGLPSTFPGLATTEAHPDIGAVQSESTAGTTAVARHHLGRRTF